MSSKKLAGCEAVCQALLEEARHKLKLHETGVGRGYYMGMVDGMVQIMSACLIPTSPPKPPKRKKK